MSTKGPRHTLSARFNSPAGGGVAFGDVLGERSNTGTGLQP
jgi:hypothetical protein